MISLSGTADSSICMAENIAELLVLFLLLKEEDCGNVRRNLVCVALRNGTGACS